MKQLTTNPLVGWVVRRIRKNKNALIVINGPTGSGKTYSAIEFALQLAERLGTPFTIKNNMDFNFQELLKKMNKPENTKPGTTFLFEEVGAVGGGAASREWQSLANRLFFSFTQTSRHKNQILIMTCPSFKFLEYGARSLIHLQMSMKRIDYAKRESFVNPFVLQVNPISGKIYFKRLRVTSKGTKFKINEIGFPHPPKDIAAEYEITKTKYTNELDKTIINSKEKVKHRIGRIDPVIFDKLVMAGLKDSEIAKTFGVNHSAIINHKTRNELVEVH